MKLRQAKKIAMNIVNQNDEECKMVDDGDGGSSGFCCLTAPVDRYTLKQHITAFKTWYRAIDRRDRKDEKGGRNNVS